MQQWRKYLGGAHRLVLIERNHKNLESFQTSKVLFPRQTRWAGILSTYDIVMKHLECRQNSTDGQSRRPDYAIAYENMILKLLATSAGTTVTESYNDLLQQCKSTHETDLLVTETRPTLIDGPTAGDSQWKSIDGALTNKSRIYAHPALHSRVTSHFHHNTPSVNFRALLTAEEV